ncbi:MAG: asparaginase [Anaerolineaceae bacterium]|nr:asparaginase [Anaerolineaceae bacterium]
MGDIELVHITRGDQVDCIHRGRVAVVDVSGDLVFSGGDADAVIYLRSCAKPFQAVAVIRSGAAEKYGFTPEELAVMAGSHNGTVEQTRIVQGILDKIDAASTDLQCGPGAPLSRSAYEQLLQGGHKPSTLEHNCSGKHSGMLAACRAQGWDIATYLQPEHPVQQMILSVVAEYAGLDASAIVLAPDGCGVPTFGLPLKNIALLFANLGAATHDAASDLGVIARAMQQNPLLFSGDKRVDASLVQATNGRLVAKDGAEGLLGVGVPDHGVGIALKVSDGNQRAHIPAVSALMRQLGYLSADEAAALESLIPSTVLNNHGVHAGEMQPVLQVDVR